MECWHVSYSAPMQHRLRKNVQEKDEQGQPPEPRPRLLRNAQQQHEPINPTISLQLVVSSASRHGHKALRKAFHHHGELSEHLARQLSRESLMPPTIHGSQRSATRRRGLHNDGTQLDYPWRHSEQPVAQIRLYDSDRAEDLRDFEEPEHSHEGHIATSEIVGLQTSVAACLSELSIVSSLSLRFHTVRKTDRASPACFTHVNQTKQPPTLPGIQSHDMLFARKGSGSHPLPLGSLGPSGTCVEGPQLQKFPSASFRGRAVHDPLAAQLLRHGFCRTTLPENLELYLQTVDILQRPQQREANLTFSDLLRLVLSGVWSV